MIFSNINFYYCLNLDFFYMTRIYDCLQILFFIPNTFYTLQQMQIQPSQIMEEQVKAYNVFQNQKASHFYLKSFNKQHNQFLEGGLHTGLITQIFGESGSGKTQMAMLFSIAAIYSNSTVGYLATQKEMHWGRFTELAYNYMNQAEFDQKEQFFKYKKCLDDYDAQMNFIDFIFREIQKSKKGGLLVIDNIYSMINASFNYFKIESAYQKTRKQAQIINKLRKLAKMTNTCVLLINKVSDVVDKKRKTMTGRQTMPSLGASWELNVDQSFEMKKGNRSDIKEMIVVHSPKCKEGKILFRIEENGFAFISEEGIQLE